MWTDGARGWMPLLSLLALLGSASGCDRCGSEALDCMPSCPQGFSCLLETNRCVTEELPRFEGEEVPGRGARVELSGESPRVATLDVARGALLVGGRSQRDAWSWRVLDRDVRAGSRRVAMARSSTHLGVAWIGRDGFYHIATQRFGDPLDSWSIERARVMGDDQEAPAYRATDDFDLGFDARGEAVIVLRDRTLNALMVLEVSAMRGWVMEVVDSGFGAQAFGCSAEQREVRRRGVGQEPDLLIDRDTVSIAYHDADCGDLRLARRGAAGRWIVTVLDRGDPLSAGLSITGRHPSLSLDPEQRLAIAYQELSGARLMYGVLRDEVFERQVVDRGEGLASTSQRPKKIVGAFARLSFGPGGLPHITYMDGTELSAMLAIATRQESGELLWQRQVLSEEGAVGFSGDHVLLARDGVLLSVSERLSVEGDTVRSSLVMVEQELQ